MINIIIQTIIENKEFLEKSLEESVKWGEISTFSKKLRNVFDDAGRKTLVGILETIDKAIFESHAFGFFNSVSAFSFVVFNLFSAPCFAAIFAMKNELGSFRKVLVAILFQTVLAWGLAVAICKLKFCIAFFWFL